MEEIRSAATTKLTGRLWKSWRSDQAVTGASATPSGGGYLEHQGHDRSRHH